MKILVTGGCGFLGSHICEYYKKKREDVIALDNLTKYELMRTGYNAKAARNYNVNFLKKIGVKMIKGDIRNKNLVMKTAQNCDYIFHTAAQPAMTVSIEQPELDFTTNVVGIFNLLEAARKYNIPLVNSSTIHVYGNAINETIKKGKDRFFRNPSTIPEDYPIMQGKITPLHASKRSAELLVQTYIDTYDIQQSVEDGNTVRLYYENRVAKIILPEEKKPELDEGFEEITEDQEETERERFKTKWSQLEAIVGQEDRIQQVAEDII